MALAVARSRSMRRSVSSIRPSSASTVVFMPSERARNSCVSRSSTRCSRSPLVMSDKILLVRLNPRTTTRSSNLDTSKNTAAKSTR